VKHMFYPALRNGSTFVDQNEWDWWWRTLPRWVETREYESITKWWQYNELDAYGSGPFRMWHASHKNTLAARYLALRDAHLAQAVWLCHVGQSRDVP
jgi:hypothetical protein